MYLEENNGAIYSVDVAFIFIAQKDKSAAVNCKLCAGQKQL